MDLQHHGIKGMHWGVRRTPEQLGHYRKFEASNGGKYSKNDTVFISGKVKFDSPLPDVIKAEINRATSADSKIIIGDAPGADTRVQEFLYSIGYKNVEVYSTDPVVRNNVGLWKVNYISGAGKETEKEIRAQKDIAMTNRSTKGIAISSDDDRVDSATALNIQRLIDSGKTVQFYDYKRNVLEQSKEDLAHMNHENRFLAHHGILGQKHGVKNGPPYPLDYADLSPEEKAHAKAKAIREGNVKEANANRNEFTDQELNAVMNRFKINQDISRLSTDKVESGLDKFSKIANTIGTIDTAAQKIIGAWNTVSKVMAAFDEPMPTIDIGNGKKGNNNNGKKGKKGNNNNNNGNNNQNNQDNNNSGSQFRKIVSEEVVDGKLRSRTQVDFNSRGEKLERRWKYSDEYIQKQEEEKEEKKKKKETE